MLDSSASSPRLFSGQVLRRFVLIFLPAALLPGCVVLALYYQDLANEQSLHEQAGKHVVDLHANIISRELNAVESDLLYLANQAVLRDFLSGGKASKQVLQDEYLLFSRHKAIYDQIRYLDAGGQEVIRINFNNGSPVVVPEPELQSKASRYYFARTILLERGQLFVSPFDLNVEHEQIERPLKPVIRVATPVFDNGGVKRGVLVLNYLGAALLQKLAQVTVSFPGSVFLLNKDGYFLRGLNPQDEWGFMLSEGKTFATHYPEAWTRFSAAERGQFQTDQGLFTFRNLPVRGALPARQLPAMTMAEPPEADSGNARMIVAARTSPEILNARADQVLGRLLLLYGVVLALVVFLAGYLAYSGAVRRNHERQLAESETRLRALSTQLISAQEDERRSLSRDLHDALGQLVTAVSLDLQRLGQTADPEKRVELLTRALHGTDCLLDRIHKISARIRPTLLDDLGLKDAVQSFLSDFEHRTGIVTRATLSFDQAQPTAVVSENLYRILQEALTNVAKHAGAREVFVGLHVDAQAAALTVRDEGSGFDLAGVDGKRLGILGMRERAELLRGTFVVRSTPGKGTSVEVNLPMASAT
ncbi:MAG TPA: ATP-binding protein [Gemmataceae bacterium]|jgi:signal transduction histidine kinase|nr:ATP-binding protein [Gemmataceae bacterium]